MTQLENIETIEKRLRASADGMRANSSYASNEYLLPVIGLIFLRHAYSRYLIVKDQIEASLSTRGGKERPLTKDDFSCKGAIYLKLEPQFDYLVELPDVEDRAQAIMHAMDLIESDYETLRDVLPKSEYQELYNDIIGQLLRTVFQTGTCDRERDQRREGWRKCSWRFGVSGEEYGNIERDR